jgi:hypothetical protein
MDPNGSAVPCVNPLGTYDERQMRCFAAPTETLSCSGILKRLGAKGR